MAEVEDERELAELMRERIAARLGKLDLTAITAATKARIPRDTIRNLFRTGSLPRVDTLTRIANALETTVAYLVGETAYPENDYDDADRLAVARAAMETAKPIPVIGFAEWGTFVVPNDDLAPIDELFMQVPGFEDKALSAVLVRDDHCNLWFEENTYVIFAWRESGVGFRDGDVVVVSHWKEVDGKQQVEFTIRQSAHGLQRAPSGNLWMTGGLLSLAADQAKYPNWTRYGGSRSNTFPPEPPDRGWHRAESLAGESADVHYLSSEFDARRHGRRLGPVTETMKSIGVVVAEVSFHVRPAGPALYASTGLDSREQLEALAAGGGESGENTTKDD